MNDCVSCGKPTQSHQLFQDQYLCHTCYQDVSEEEMKELRREAKHRVAEKIANSITFVLSSPHS